ncbi:hypothetical protein ACWGKO_02135 [Streptomyces griseoincarnatus]
MATGHRDPRRLDALIESLPLDRAPDDDPPDRSVTREAVGRVTGEERGERRASAPLRTWTRLSSPPVDGPATQSKVRLAAVAWVRPPRVTGWAGRRAGRRRSAAVGGLAMVGLGASVAFTGRAE